MLKTWCIISFFFAMWCKNWCIYSLSFNLKDFNWPGSNLPELDTSVLDRGFKVSQSYENLVDVYIYIAGYFDVVYFDQRLGTLQKLVKIGIFNVFVLKS